MTYLLWPQVASRSQATAEEGMKVLKDDGGCEITPEGRCVCGWIRLFIAFSCRDSVLYCAELLDLLL